MEGSERFIYDSSPGEKFSRSRSNDVCRLITDQPPAERTGGGETAINSPTISVIGKLLASLPAHPRWFTTCAKISSLPLLDESEILPRSFFPPRRGGSKLLLEKYHLLASLLPSHSTRARPAVFVSATYERTNSTGTHFLSFRAKRSSGAERAASKFRDE